MVRPIELEDLAGLEVSAVCFVRDYIELHFDGPILRCIADPAIEAGGTRVEHPGPGSRDALCRLIGRTVLSGNDEVDRLVLRFAESESLVVSRFSTVAGPEVAHLVPFVDGALDTAGMLIWENLGDSGEAGS